MAKKIYTGIGEANIFIPSTSHNASNIGITYSYDKDKDEYTLNGKTTSPGDIVLESNLLLDWAAGEKYEINITQLGGVAKVGEGSGITYSFSIFSKDNTKYLRNGNLSMLYFPGDLKFSGNAIAESGGTGFKLLLQIWRIGTVFENYKFRITARKYGVAREVKKGYVGIKELKNIINIDNVTLENVTSSNGIMTHTAGNVAMVIQDLPTPVANHKYYGRCYQKAPNDYTYGDGRFEYYLKDDPTNSIMTFGFMEPTNNEWKLMSSIQSLTAPNTGSWKLRSFTVSGSSDAYRKELMIVDLTELFGENNEPSKEWCDANIPYVKDTYVDTRKWGIVNGVARKIKKGFIGINGIARQFFSGQRVLSYYGKLGTITGRYSLGNVSFNGIALFAGGRTADSTYSAVFGYNTALTRTTYTSLANTKHSMASGATDNHAIFAGGVAGSTKRSDVDAYDKNFTKTNPTNLHKAKEDLCGASSSTHVLVAGGKVASFETTQVVECYDLNLNKTTLSNLENAVSDFAGTHVGDYYLFFGGRLGSASGSVIPNVNIYDKNLTKLTYTSFNQKRYTNRAASTKKYAFFGPGRSDTSTAVSNVDAIDTSLVKHAVTNTSVSKVAYAAVGFDDYVIFAGGENDSSVHKTVEAYDDNLVKYNLTDLSTTAARLGGAITGSYAVFVCGEAAKGMGTTGSVKTDINVYQVL